MKHPCDEELEHEDWPEFRKWQKMRAEAETRERVLREGAGEASGVRDKKDPLTARSRRDILEV